MTPFECYDSLLKQALPVSEKYIEDGAARIHELARGSIRLCAVRDNLALKAHHTGHHASGIHNGIFHSTAHIHMFKVRVIFQQKHTGLGHVVHV